MNIGIDIDDTIANTFEVMFAYAQKYTVEKLHRSAKIKEIKNIKTHRYCKAMHDWTQEEEDNFFKEYYEKIMLETKPLTCAVESISKLKNQGHKIILITARFDFDSFDIRKTTKKWLEEYKIHYDKLVINASTKKEAAIENNVDVFIDDSFKNCVDVAESGAKTFIMDTKYNGGLEAENIKRVYSWSNIEEYIREEI